MTEFHSLHSKVIVCYACALPYAIAIPHAPSHTSLSNLFYMVVYFIHIIITIKQCKEEKRRKPYEKPNSTKWLVAGISENLGTKIAVAD